MAIGCFALDVIVLLAAGGTPVRVVDGAGEPVAGAWVAACGRDWNDAVAPWFEPLSRWVVDGGDAAPACGVTWRRADEDGLVEVEAVGAWTHVFAVTSDMGGAVGVELGAAGVTTLVVRPHRWWRVPVVDPEQPGVVPDVAVEFGVESLLSLRTSFCRLATVRPDPIDGVAAFGPVDLLLDAAHGIDLTFVARLDLPASLRPRLRCRASEIELHATPLALPPTASLEVRVVDRHGRRVAIERDVELRVDRERPLFSRWWQNADLGTWTSRTVGGSARFDRVGLDAALVLAGPDGRDWCSWADERTPADQRGPLAPFTRPHETRLLTLVDLDDPPRCLTVRGRWIDERGAALAGHRLRLGLFDRQAGKSRNDWIRGRSSDDGVVTAADGGFEQELLVDAGEMGSVDVDVVDMGRDVPGSFAPIAITTVALPPSDGSDEAPPVADLGAVVARLLSPLVRGRIVDEQGAPIAGADVWLRALKEEWELPDARLPFWRFGCQRQRSGEDGCFEFRGLAPELPRWLRATAFGRREAKEFPLDPLVARDGDLEVVLASEPTTRDGKALGHLFGTLLLDRDVPRTALDLRLVQAVRVDGNDSEGWCDGGFSVDPLAPERFAFCRAPAGEWLLSVVHHPFHRGSRDGERVVGPIAVTVEAGRAVVLPPIDLRGKVHAKRVRIADRSGATIGGAFVVQRVRGERKTAPQWEMIHEGETLLTTVGTWPELHFFAAGHRRVARRFSHDREETVVLPPPVIARFELPPGVELPPAPLTLEVTLDFDDPTAVGSVGGADTPPIRVEGTFDASRALEVALPSSGSWRLFLCVVRRDPSPDCFERCGHGVGQERFVELRDVDEAQPFELAITPAQLAEAVRQLAGAQRR